MTDEALVHGDVPIVYIFLRCFFMYVGLYHLFTHSDLNVMIGILVEAYVFVWNNVTDAPDENYSDKPGVRFVNF